MTDPRLPLCLLVCVTVYVIKKQTLYLKNVADVSLVNDSHTESTFVLLVLIHFYVKTLFLNRGGVSPPFPLTGLE